MNALPLSAPSYARRSKGKAETYINTHEALAKDVCRIQDEKYATYLDVVLASHDFSEAKQ